MIKLRNGVLIPKMGLGTFLMNDEEAYSAVLSAIEIGYRHIDTAQMYQNEAVIGRAIKDSKIDRKELFITTKLMYHHSKENTKLKIMESLEKLQTNYLDLILIHWPSHDDSINLQTWQVFEELLEQGIVRAIGVSNFSRYQLLKLFEGAKVKPHVNQIEHHFNLPQIATKKFLLEHDIQTIGYAPLIRGRIFSDSLKELVEPIAIRHNATIAQVAIAWGLAKGAIMIPKSTSKERQLENYESLNLKLDLEDIEKLDNIAAGKRYYSDPANNTYGKYIK